MPAETGEKRSVTLGEVVNEVRWDYDPSQRLLSPLVEAARFFEAFPWDGEDEADPPPSAETSVDRKV